MTKYLWFLCALTMLSIGCKDPRDQYDLGERSGDSVNVTLNVIFNDYDGDGYYTCYIDGTQHPKEDCEAIENGDGGQKRQGLSGKLDCNDHDKDIYPGAPELCDQKDNQCPGDLGYGQIDEGITCECFKNSDCADNIFCNGAEVCVNHACQFGALPCASNQVCDEAGDMCVGCLTNSDCTNTVFCDGDETCDSASNTCQPGTPSCAGQVCDEAKDVCVQCMNDSDCAGGFCVSNTCVGCRNDNDCPDSKVCNANNSCEPVPCSDEGNVCTLEVILNHVCTHPPIPLCCHGPQFDSECVGSHPANLPPHYMWGCSNTPVPPFGVNVCTSCLDDDGDGYCGTEICSNGWDDDADGLTDETPCDDICDHRGAKIKNISSTNWSVYVGAHDENGQSVAEQQKTLCSQKEYGDTCYTDVYLYSHPKTLWDSLSDSERQLFCTTNMRCENFAGQSFSPVLTADSLRACQCPYNGSP